MDRIMSLRETAERDIVQRAIEACIKAGFTLHAVDDGGDEPVVVSEVTDAVTAVFDLDEAHVYFTYNAGLSVAWFHAIMGNDGWDVIADYTVSLDEPMESIDPLIMLWERRLG